MPKSRGRRNARKPRRTSQAGRAGHDARHAQALRELPIIQAVDAAEARADAHGALDLIERDLAARGATDGAGFWRPQRLVTLWQMVVFESVLPAWVTSRWVLAQAAQWLDPARRGLALKALDAAIDIRGGRSTLVGVDDVDAGAKVMDRDWVHRQLWLYEFGALQHFLLRGASQELLARADRIHDWARAPMGAFRLVSESPGTLTWLDLATRRQLETPDLGAGALVEPGECAIGRIVPTEAGVMFESAPLHLPDDLAHRVVDDPVDWMAPVAEGCRRTEQRERVFTGGRDFACCTDVPTAIQDFVAIDLAESLGLSIDVETADELVALEVALLRAALEDRLPPVHLVRTPWPTIGAMLLRPRVFVEFGQGLRQADVPALWALADRLAEPAAEVCRCLAEEVEAGAGSRSA